MALLIDMIILLLLAGTLGYAYLVDRRVRAMMAALQSLGPLVGEFSAAVDRSESTVRSLQAVPDTRAAAPRADEPRLTRTHAAQARPGAAQMPLGMTRVSNKADLVRGFFDTARSSGA